MQKFNNILDNILAGEKLQTPADWYLALKILESQMEAWADTLTPNFENLDREGAKAEVHKALVLIEVSERLAQRIKEDFKSEPSMLADWQNFEEGRYAILQMIVGELCEQFELGWMEDLIAQHFTHVWFVEE